MFAFDSILRDITTWKRLLWLRLPVKLGTLFLITATPTFGAGHSSARSAGMAGAFTGLARGVQAARYNPANLGLSGNTGVSLEIVGAGVSIQNNAFSLNDYNKYTGAVLSTSDKQYLLDRIPEDGFDLRANVAASALSVSSGSFAFSVTGVGVADVSLNRDIFDLILNGNIFADTIEITGSYSEAVSYLSFGLSYGYPLYRHEDHELTAGATIKYLKGLGVERVTKLNGFATTFATGFAGAGEIVAQTASGGSGFGLDLGFAYTLNRDQTIGIHISNVLSRISWNGNPEEQGYIFSIDTLTIANAGSDFFVSTDYSKPIAGFATSLPTVLTAGFASTSGKVLWAVDWEQGLERAYGASTHPRLSAGAEYYAMKFLPLRAGYSIGGDRNSSLSIGSGLRFGGYYFDYAAVTGSSISSGSAKGLNVTFSTGLHF